MLNKRLKAKQNLSRFDRYVDANVVITDSVPFVQPANMRLAVSFSENILDNQVSVYVNTREFKLPALTAGQIHRLDWIEADKKISAGSSVFGVLTFYVLDDWMRPIPIGLYRNLAVVSENNVDPIVTETNDRIMME